MSEIDQYISVALAGTAIEPNVVALKLAQEVLRLRAEAMSQEVELTDRTRFLHQAEEQRDELWTLREGVAAQQVTINYLRRRDLRTQAIAEGRDDRFRTIVHRMVARYIREA